MGRRALWLVSLPLAVGVWLPAYRLMRLATADHHGDGMPGAELARRTALASGHGERAPPKPAPA